MLGSYTSLDMPIKWAKDKATMKPTESKTQTGNVAKPALVCRKCGNNLHSQVCFIAHKREAEGASRPNERLPGKETV
jgi:hypothetical protein